MKIYAIVPIKHESTRVPGKNYRLMNNKPLFHYVLETLSRCPSISRIYVDTNSPIVKEGVKQFFPNIVIYDRPKNLWSGDTSTNTLLMNIIDDLNLDADFYLQTHVTNPLLTSETVENAIKSFLSNSEKSDSLFSVKRLQTRLYDKEGKDMNHNRFNLIPTQDLHPIYEENSCIYLFSKSSLFTYKSRISKNAMMYEMSDLESQDIDYEDDFILAEQLIKLKKSRPSNDVIFGKNVQVINPVNLYGCTLEDNVFVGPFVEIQKGVTIGENTRISSHSFICDGVKIGADCFIGHGVVFINDKFDKPMEDWLKRETIVGYNVRIGSNATILPVKIGNNAIIGAGAVVTKDVPNNCVVVGNPARCLNEK